MLGGCRVHHGAPLAAAAAVLPGFVLASAEGLRRRGGRRGASGATWIRGLAPASCEARAAPPCGVHVGPNFAGRFESFCLGGVKKLQLITDFDQTLTSFIGSTGRRGDDCHQLLLTRLDVDSVPGLRASPWMHLKATHEMWVEGDQEGLRALARKLGIDLASPRNLVDWWFATYQRVSTEFGLWNHTAPCVALSDVRVRGGLAATFAWLQAHEVPTLIVSAGLKQVIQGILEDKGCPIPACASIVANDLKQAQVTVDDVTKEKALSIAPREYVAASAGRPCVLMLGDKVEDLAPADGLHEDCSVLSICFLSAGLKEGREAPGSDVQKALQHFDVVLTGDASMDFLNRLLQAIAEGDAASLGAVK